MLFHTDCDPFEIDYVDLFALKLHMNLLDDGDGMSLFSIPHFI